MAEGHKTSRRGTPYLTAKPTNRSIRHVLVTGAGGPSGIAAVSALRARGLTVVAVDMLDVAHEADVFYKVPAARSAGYIDVLWQIVEKHRIGWIFPTVSEELVLMAEHASQFRRFGVAIFIGDLAAVRTCDDKWETAVFMREHGIRVPASALGSAGDAAVRDLGFPTVSRPRVGRGGRGVVLHDRPGIAPAVPSPLWQHFISGTEYDVLQVLHPAWPHELLASRIFEKTALRDGRVGNATGIRPAEAPDVAELALAAARALGLYGPMDMDIRRNDNGIPYLLEINARIGAHTLSAPAIFDALVSLHLAGCLGE